MHKRTWIDRLRYMNMVYADNANIKRLTIKSTYVVVPGPSDPVPVVVTPFIVSSYRVPEPASEAAAFSLKGTKNKAMDTNATPSNNSDCIRCIISGDLGQR